NYYYMDKFNYRAIILILLASIIVYINSLFNPFIWDDSALVRDNFLIKDWRHTRKLFTTDLYYSKSRSNFYRPLQSLSYMLDYSLWRLKPFGYRLTNIILHSTVAILAYLLFLLVSKQKGVSLIGALFFVIHPIHTEAVVYISGRADSLMGIFLLSSFILFTKHMHQDGPKGQRLYFSSLACFALSLLCKEPALIFPFAL
ncbi:MAG: phospholipid carrier-dependent glycosyltransferase, partial [Candidatus Omnitrophota bacterium]